MNPGLQQSSSAFAPWAKRRFVSFLASSLLCLACLSAQAQTQPDPAIDKLRGDLAALQAKHGEASAEAGNAMMSLAGKLADADQKEAARDLYYRAVKNYQQRYPATDPNHVLPSFRLADVLDDLGETDEAISTYQTVIISWQKSLGAHHWRTLTALSQLAGVELRKANFKEAVRLYGFSLPGWQATKGKESTEALGDLRQLIRAKIALGDLAEAKTLLDSLLAVTEKPGRKPDLDGMDALSVASELYLATGLHESALTYNQRAIDGLTALYSADSDSVLSAERTRAGIFYRNGQYQDALLLYERVYQAHLKRWGAGNVRTVNSNRLRALVFANINRPQEALKIQKATAEYFEKKDGKQALTTLDVWLEYADTLWLVGRFVEAGQIKERVLRSLLETVGQDHPVTLTALHAYANTLADLGEYGKAAELQEKVRELNAKKFGAQSRATLTVNNPLAIDYIRGGFPAKAQALMQETIKIIERDGDKHPAYTELPFFYRTLGESLAAQGRKDAALEQYRKSYDLALRLFGPDHFMLARVAIFWSHVEPDVGRRIELGQQAYRIGKSIDATDTIWRAADALRSAYEQFGTPDLAILYGKQSVNALQSLRAQVSATGQAAASQYLTDKRSVYTELADLMIANGRLAEAQDVLRMLKEDEYHDFVTRSEKVDSRQTVMTLNAQEQAWTERFQSISAKIVQASKDKAALDARAKLGLTEPEKQQLAKLDDELKTARQAFDGATKQMLADARKAAGGASDRLGSEVISSVRALRGDLRQLGHGAVLLHYVMVEDKLWILLTTPEVQVARQSAVTAADLNRKINGFRLGLKNPAQDIRPMAQDLYKLLVGPVEDDLKQAQAKTLMLSLDGAIRYVPFAALHDGQKWLVETYRTALFTEAAKSKIKDKPQAEWTLSGLGLSKAIGGFDALPAVKEELASLIRKSGGVLEGEAFLDDAFTLASVRSALADQRPVLHIASHFKFTPGTESDSYLLLGDGAHLSLRQIREDDLQFDHVDLLTLSACETAVGDNARGSEVEGLGAIAQKQGAKAVLATLWPVADRSTGLFMREMYRVRVEQKLTKAEAIRQVQLGFLEGKFAAAGSPGEAARGARAQGAAAAIAVSYNHPYFWAPFILMGNWL